MRQLLMNHNQPKCKWKHLCLFNGLYPFLSGQDWAIDVPAAYGFLMSLICSLGICWYVYRNPES